MKKSTKLLSLILSTSLATQMISSVNINATKDSITFYDVKNNILDLKAYDAELDTNHDGNMNVFDVIRANKTLIQEESYTDLKEKVYLLETQIESLYQKLNEKTDAEEGKQLSSNDYTDEEKQKLEGLNNYDDTQIKSEVSEISSALSSKVDKEEGKQLSSNDYTDEEKQKLEGLNNYDDAQIKSEVSEISSALSSKVDKEEGKQLSSNDYTDEEKQKLESLNNYDDAEIKTELQNQNELIGNLIDIANDEKNKYDEKIYKIESNKVDKEEGKQLSSNDYTDEEKQKLESLNNYDDTEIKTKINDIKSDLSQTKDKLENYKANAYNSDFFNTPDNVYNPILLTFTDNYYYNENGEKTWDINHCYFDATKILTKGETYNIHGCGYHLFVTQFNSDGVITYASGQFQDGSNFYVQPSSTQIIISVIKTNKDSLCLSTDAYFEPTIKKEVIPKDYIIVDKNGSGDYTSLTEGLYYAYRHPCCTVYVRDGEYDIIQEYGESFFENFNPSNDTWGTSVGNGMKIYFSPNAIVKCINTMGNSDSKLYFTPFNVKDDLNFGDCGAKGVEIYGLNCEVTNTRYCIHDDNGDGKDTYNVFKDCVLKNNGNNMYGFDQCIGGGLGYSSHITIENCRFYLKSDSDVRYGVSYHNTEAPNCENAKSTLTITNCYVYGENNTIAIHNHGLSTLMSDIMVTNCSVGTDIIITDNNTDGGVQNMNVILFNNHVRN